MLLYMTEKREMAQTEENHLSDTTKEPIDTTDEGYTAVLYFHGMGSQRRYEECSRLIDAIDTYLSNAYRQRGQRLGYLAGIKPRIEPSYGDDKGTETYIRTRHAKPDSHKLWEAPETRFYEVYWAPIMAGMGSPGSVATWILKQAKRPLQTLRCPWRERHRLRRSALAALFERETGWPEGTRPDDFDKLLRLYTAFERLDAVRDYPEGHFAQFLDFIAKKYAKRPDTTKRLSALAQAWHRTYQRTEARNLFFLSTILLAIVLSGGLLVWSVLSLLQLVSGLTILGESGLPFADYVREQFSPTVSTASGLVASLLLFLGLGKFLTESMGDVEAWATYEETDVKHERRRRVIEEGCRLVTHVLSSPRCNRVVVVSHSLGTSVAHDTLLALARDNRAINAANPISGPVPLEKIRHFVTIASPIDKINYFFESTRSAFHRYLRVIDTLRGDISEAPFAKNGKPYVHWVNFWDEADIISGPLHSPVGRKSFRNRVDNVHVANLHAPDPGASHSAYFRNRSVISKLFEMIYEDRHSFSDAPLLPGNKGYDYDSMMFGPGESTGMHRTFFRVALALPWVTLAYLVLLFAGAGVLRVMVLGLLAILLVTLIIGVVARKLRGMRLEL